ncbi:hypothetical protein TWF106_004872 [Orbilia oligospora]|uniref:CorA metal ion transporter n=1 Tax=Orbilia oligospora TaxID=2813651 RepID=A0A7C8UXF8_ORBOL|nr:hypothetical protein TWF106_004872 [Orbilia oligospora]
MAHSKLASIELGFLRTSSKNPPVISNPNPPIRVCKINITSAGSLDISHCALSALESLQSHPDVTAQIFAIEGSEREDLKITLGPWTQLDKELWSHFLAAHCSKGEDMIQALERENEIVFSLDWKRLVAQSKDQHEIEYRILSGKPYDLNTYRDPMDLSLNHKRYGHWPDSPYREYVFISPSEDDTFLYHAAKERVSLCFGSFGGLPTGILLFDPIRYHNISGGTYQFRSGNYDWSEELVPCFLDPTTIQEKPPERPRKPSYTHRKMIFDHTETSNNDHDLRLKRFLDILETLGKESTDKTPQYLVERALIQLACKDLRQILKKVSYMLDTIELSLHDDTVLQDSLSMWRYQLGTCRNMLFHENISLRRLQGSIKSKVGARSNQISSSSRTNSGNVGYQKDMLQLLEELRELTIAVEYTHKRVESDFQALMSSMSIVESRRAISETEVVSKLTQLAFFFIPLSLVAAIFGMNINEFENKLTWWHWLAVSVSSSSLTYILLYWSKMTNRFQQLSNLMSTLSLNRIRKRTVQWMLVAESIVKKWPIIFKVLVLLVFLAAAAIATFVVASLDSFSIVVRVLICTVAFWAPVLAFGYWWVSVSFFKLPLFSRLMMRVSL